MISIRTKQYLVVIFAFVIGFLAGQNIESGAYSLKGALLRPPSSYPMSSSSSSFCVGADRALLGDESCCSGLEIVFSPSGIPVCRTPCNTNYFRCGTENTCCNINSEQCNNNSSAGASCVPSSTCGAYEIHCPGISPRPCCPATQGCYPVNNTGTFQCGAPSSLSSSIISSNSSSRISYSSISSSLPPNFRSSSSLSSSRMRR